MSLAKWRFSEYPIRSEVKSSRGCVVLKPGKTLTADELIAYCGRSLANFKVPRSIEFSETELPKSGSGKILKRLLRDAAWARQERAVA
jgi:acyl-CoA synthetase (AMP-forming)/AMP-acid ligase II